MKKKVKSNINKKKYVPVKVLIRRSKTGLGLYAGGSLKKGDFVIEYIGIPLTNKESEYHPGRYLYEVNSRLTLNGSGRKNIARYINHSCRPNCKPETRLGRVLIFAKRPIKAGEELTYNYGREYTNRFIKPTGCRCSHCHKEGKNQSKG